MRKHKAKKRGLSRRPQPPPRVDDGQLIKTLILKGLEAFEESFRRKYPGASQETIRDHMTRYLCERTRFEYEHPRRSFRYGRHN